MHNLPRMRYRPQQRSLTGCALGVAALLSCAAQASDLPLSFTEYADGTTGSNDIVPLATPGAYGYEDLSLQPQTATGGIIPGSGSPGSSFYDAFLINITSSAGSSISSTIDLGSQYDISNFQERLYQYTGTAPTVGLPGGTVYDFWTTSLNLGTTSGAVAELPSTFLPAGTYVLEVRGDVTGALGGSYSGTLQLSAVPLPSGLSLLLVGLFCAVGCTSAGLRRALQP